MRALIVTGIFVLLAVSSEILSLAVITALVFWGIGKLFNAMADHGNM